MNGPHATTRRGAIGTAILATLPRPEATPTPGRIRTLDQADPVAVELARLYDALLASHGPWRRAYRALEDYTGGYRYDRDEECRLCAEHTATSRAGRVAYHQLLRAVVEADGRDRPTEAEWMSYGCPLAAVRVGNRLYVVTADVDSEWDDGMGALDPFGLAEVVVIEL